MLFEENLKVIQEPSSTITDRNFLLEGKLLRYTNYIQALDSLQGCDMMHGNKMVRDIHSLELIRSLLNVIYGQPVCLLPKFTGGLHC
jgi:hypothetical protein